MKRADLVAEGFFGGGVFEVHRGIRISLCEM